MNKKAPFCTYRYSKASRFIPINVPPVSIQRFWRHRREERDGGGIYGVFLHIALQQGASVHPTIYEEDVLYLNSDCVLVRLRRLSARSVAARRQGFFCM